MEQMTLEDVKHIDEIFDFFDTGEENGCRVVPATYKQHPTDTRLAIFIRGEFELASVIMAELMTRLEDLSDVAEQQAAAEEERVIVPDKRIITPTDP